MGERESCDVVLEDVARVLIRSFLMGAAVLALWLVILLAGGGWIYRTHSAWFDLSRHDFDVIMYCGMALFKTAIVTLFLIPYVSIRLVLRASKSAS